MPYLLSALLALLLWPQSAHAQVTLDFVGNSAANQHFLDCTSSEEANRLEQTSAAVTRKCACIMNRYHNGVPEQERRMAWDVFGQFATGDVQAVEGAIGAIALQYGLSEEEVEKRIENSYKPVLRSALQSCH